MKINVECMRDIMFYLEDHLTAYRDERHINRIKFDTIDLIVLSKAFENTYDAEDVWYSTKMLCEAGFVQSDIQQKTENYLAFTYIHSLTYQGHQFLESIRSDTIWNKTKATVSKVGSHTLQFIEATAQMVAVEAAKQMVISATIGNAKPQ